MYTPRDIGELNVCTQQETSSLSIIKYIVGTFQTPVGVPRGEIMEVQTPHYRYILLN